MHRFRYFAARELCPFGASCPLAHDSEGCHQRVPPSMQTSPRWTIAEQEAEPFTPANLIASIDVVDHHSPVQPSPPLAQTAPVREPHAFPFDGRFGRAGAILAETLHAFSLDIVNIVCRYYMHACVATYPQPKLLNYFGGQHDDDGGFGIGCKSVAVAPDGNIWVGSYQRMQLFDNDGKFIQRVTYDQHDTHSCRAIAFVGDEVFLAIQWSGIVVCALDGRFVRTQAEQTTPKASFWGLAAHTRTGLLYAADFEAKRVAVMRTDGSIARVLIERVQPSSPASAYRSHDPEDAILTPVALAIDFDGNVAVLYLRVGIIQVYDEHGRLLRTIGSYRERDDWKAPVGVLGAPRALAFDSAGNLLVAEYKPERIQVFTRQGQLLTVIGESGSAVAPDYRDNYGPGRLCGPTAICVDNDGRILLADHIGVHVYAFDPHDDVDLATREFESDRQQRIAAARVQEMSEQDTYV